MTALGITAIYPVDGVYQDLPGSDPVTTNHVLPLHNLRAKTFYFADADNNELFITPPGCQAVAWQPSGVSHLGNWTIGATGIIFTGTANGLGWLHCLCNGTAKTGSTTSEAPVAKGTSGWVNHGNGIVLNERGSATPATVTNGRRLPSKDGLKLQIFELPDGVADNDTWECTTSRLCPGVVAVAWQASATADDVNVTLNAANDVVFNMTAPTTAYGWLWVWKR